MFLLTLKQQKHTNCASESRIDTFSNKSSLRSKVSCSRLQKPTQPCWHKPSWFIWFSQPLAAYVFARSSHTKQCWPWDLCHKGQLLDVCHGAGSYVSMCTSLYAFLAGLSSIQGVPCLFHLISLRTPLKTQPLRPEFDLRLSCLIKSSLT